LFFVIPLTPGHIFGAIETSDAVNTRRHILEDTLLLPQRQALFLPFYYTWQTSPVVVVISEMCSCCFPLYSVCTSQWCLPQTSTIRQCS
jgi:hypothetical protein